MGLDDESYDFLVSVNNTKAELNTFREWDQFSKYINGFGRLIFYKQTKSITYSGSDPDLQGDTIYDPNDVANIEIYEVYETYLENGLVSKEPEFGRIFKLKKNTNL